MFDALTHLYRCPDPAAVLRDGREAGVAGVMLAGIDPAGWLAQHALSSPGVLVAYGLHPWNQSGTIDDLEAATRSLGRPAAIGEIGLDRSPAHRDGLARQIIRFREQLALAQRLDLPVILHVVRAHGHALSVFDDCPAPGGMVHGFSGPPEIAEQWLRRGMMLSYGPLLLNTNARRSRASAALTPLDRLLIETDAPDQLSGPAHLPEVLAALAALRPEPLEVLSQATGRNARRLFARPHA
jgi:TatD DNase family protein